VGRKSLGFHYLSFPGPAIKIKNYTKIKKTNQNFTSKKKKKFVTKLVPLLDALIPEEFKFLPLDK
jgi:hypothetical protein